jgi:DNA-binding CsgD family transcriptional regulator
MLNVPCPESGEQLLPSRSGGESADRALAWLTMTNIPAEHWCAVIDQRRKLIGRSAQAEIRVSNRFPFVSRRHAEVWGDQRGVYLTDVGSLSGTHVNGVWVAKGRTARMAVGDRIWLGGVEFQVESDVSPLARVVAEIGLELDESDEDSVATVIGETRPLPIRYQLQQLTPAELDLVLWMCRGYLHDDELGKILYRSPNTVRTQVGSILRKLGLGSRADVVGRLRRSNRSSDSE